jgi:hypothetical protein
VNVRIKLSGDLGDRNCRPFAFPEPSRAAGQ